MYTADSFRPLPPVCCVQFALDDLLTTLEVGEAGTSQRSADGVPLCLSSGSALFFRGRVVVSHLPPAELAPVGMALAHKDVLTRSADSAAVSFHMPLWVSHSLEDG